MSEVNISNTHYNVHQLYTTKQTRFSNIKYSVLHKKNELEVGTSSKHN